MDEIAGLLCGVCVVIVFITIFGHGIWLLGAAMLRLLSGQPQGPGKAARSCHQCYAKLPPQVIRCPECGTATRTPPLIESEDDATSAVKMIGWLSAGQRISQDQCDQMLAVLKRPSKKLQDRPIEPSGAPVPAPEATGGVAASALPKDGQVIDAILVDEPATPKADRPVPVESATSEPVSLPPSPPIADQDVVFGRMHQPPTVPPVSSAPAVAVPGPAAHALDREYDERETTAVRVAARKQFGDLLKSFMAERNIRWGEVISGILIVGSAVGLVISLRATLSDRIPYFPALIFLLITLAIHGSGLYTLRRWNLRATSQGVLIISLLLTPLNFLAAILLSGSEHRAVTDPIYLLAVLLGLAVTAWITFSAGRALVRNGWWRVSVAVLATSVGQLIIDRQTPGDPSLLRTCLLAALPLGGFLVANLSQLRIGILWRRMAPELARRVLTVLGVSVFALLIPLGLLVSHVDSLTLAFAQLSPTISLASTALLALGLMIRRRSRAKRLAGLATAGTALAVFGGLQMGLAVLLAWPDPQLLIVVGLANLLILVAVAFLGDLPVLHVGAVACGTLAAVVAFLMWQQCLPADESSSSGLLAALLIGRNSLVLSGAAAISAVTGVLLGLWRRREDAVSYLAASGLVAVSAIGVTVYAGFFTGRDANLAAPVLGAYGILSLAVAILLCVERGWLAGLLTGGDETGSHDTGDVVIAGVSIRTIVQPLAWLSTGLLFAALLHAFWLNEAVHAMFARWDTAVQRPLLLSLVTHSLLMIVTGAIIVWRTVGIPLRVQGKDRWYALLEPLLWSAAATAALALPIAVWIRDGAVGLHGGYLVAVGLVAFGLAVLYRNNVLYAVFQALFGLAIGYFVAAFCETRDWGDEWYFDTRHLLAQMIALSAWCSISPLLRRTTERWQAARALLCPDWPTVDLLLQGVIVLGFTLVAGLSCSPGILHELGVLGIERGPAMAFEATGLAWSTLCAIGLAVLCFCWERLNSERLAALALLAVAAVFLIALQFADASTMASSMRWLFALYAVLTAIVIWAREPLSRWLDGWPWLRVTPISARDNSLLRQMVLAIGVLPVVVLTTVVVWRVTADLTVGVPADATWFARMGTTVSYGVPLLALVAVLLGHAIREKQQAYTLAGSLLFQYFVTLAYLLHAPGDRAGYFAGLLQWNTCAAGAYGLLWLALLRWMRSEAEVQDATALQSPSSANWLTTLQNHLGMPLAIQFSASYVLLAILSIWAFLAVLVHPGGVSAYSQRLGEPIAFVAWFLVATGFGWCWWRTAIGGDVGRFSMFTKSLGSAAADNQADDTGKRSIASGDQASLDLLLHAASHFVIGLIPLIAMAVGRYDTLGNWNAFHCLTAGWLLAATGLTVGSARWKGFWREATLVCVLTTVLAYRGSVHDAHIWAPWWSVGAAAWTALLTIALGLLRRRQLFAYASVLLAASAGMFYWLNLLLGSTPSGGGDQAVASLVVGNLTVVCLVASFWLAVDIWYQRARGEDGLSAERIPRIHVVTSVIAMVVAAMLLAGVCFVNSAAGHEVSSLLDAGAIAMLLALGLLVFAALWDQRCGLGLGAPYIWGGLVLVFILDLFRLPIRPAFSGATLAVAGYVTLTGLLWHEGVRLAAWAQQARIPHPVGLLTRASGWLPTVNVLAAALSMVTALIVVMTYPERDWRFWCALVPAFLAVGLGAIAQKERRALLQYVSLLFTGLAAIYLGWADIGPKWDGAAWLARLIRLLIVLCTVTFLYGAVVPRWIRRPSSWFGPVRHIAVTFAGGALLSLGIVLLVEFSTFRPGIGAPVDTAQMMAVAVVLTALIAGLIAIALQPGRDPLELSERGRMAYVYVAEIVGTLLFVHIFLCRPDWFAGFFRPYWPYVVLGIAFIGVGVGEVFQRSGHRVLAEPLQRTGAFLPLLPALGFWAVAAEGTNYSSLLFFVGVLYVLLCMLRRSAFSGLAAAVAGNGALWSLMQDTGMSFWKHPQFWLIPPAVSIMVAAQLNRHRLTKTQLASIRYLCVLGIYISSTSEIFLRGIGESLWPPVILASLSVAGVFLGMVLRIRAFLYLGSGFVLLSVISMVWHAALAIDHTWPWWAFGVGLGICILIFFGFFEKKRPEMLRWVEELQAWER